MAPPDDTHSRSDGDALDAGLAAGWGAARDSVFEALARLGGVEPARVELRASTPGPGGAARATDSAAQLLPHGRGTYALYGEIARGGMGVILRGRDANLGRDVALKVLREDCAQRPEILRRFVEEAQIAGQLQHPGIVPVYDLGLMADERPYFAMKLIEGRTLAALLAERGESERRKLLDAFETVCQTVAYAHSRGVIHRDLKPANVLIGEFGEVQVVDWGLAKVLDAPHRDEGAAFDGAALERVHTGAAEPRSRSMSGSVMGTPAYMPPEQARGEVERLDERSDVFALGAMLCEILTGLPPYDGDSQSTLSQAAEARLDDALRRLDACDADGELIALCKQFLQPRPDDRPRSAAIVAERVHAYLASVEDRARAAQVRAAEARVRSRAIALSSAAGIVLVLLGAGTWLWVQEQRSQRSRETDRGVAASLQDATLARGRQDWTAALAELERARARLERGDASDTLRAEVASVGAAIEAEARTARAAAELAADNAALLAQLQDMRQPEGNTIYPTHWEELDQRYAAIASAHGLQLDQLSVEDAARALAGRGIAVELASALDEWSSVRLRADNETGADHLRQIADALDREPSRSRLRAALAANDVAALSTIAASDAVPTLAAPTIRLLARALLVGGEPELASRLLLAARRRFPQDFALAIECARALRLCKPARSAEAVAHYEAALAMRPQGPEIWHELGQMLVNELGRAADALELFRQAVERAPNDGHLHFHVGHALTILGQHAEAIGNYRRSLELSPDYAIALLDLGISLDALGRTQEAVDNFGRALQLDPSSALAHYNLAVSLVTLGRDQEALASYQRALELDPKLVHVHLGIGNTLGRLKRFDEALEHYRREIEIDSRDGSAHYYMGWTLNRLSRDREAIDEVRRALELRPSEALWHRFLAWMLATTEHEDLRDTAAALVHARRAVELAPDNGDYVGVLGVASYASGDFSAAREHLLRAVDLAGENGVRVLFLALSEAHLGDRASARDHFEQLAPSFDELIQVFPSLKRFVQEARDLAAKQG